MVVSDRVADVVAAAEKLRADDRLITDPAVLLGDVEALLDAVTTVQAVLVRRLGAAVEVDATRELCGRAAKAWLHEDLLLAGGEAGRWVQLAKGLPDAPVTQQAFDTARISTAHAAAIVKALGSLPAELRATVEPHLVERARTCPPKEIAGFVDELLDALGLDKDSDLRRERRHAERGLDLAKTWDRTRSISGTLMPDVAERLEAALAAAAAKCGADDTHTPRQRRHDALAAIADAYLAATEPSFAGAPRTVLVTMDLDVLEGRLRDAWITLPSGATISADTARRLACDAAIIPVVLGGAGEVLDIGVADHEFTVAIRRAAWIRDRGRCAFPDCRNRTVELHHLVFRRHGGATSVDNAAWLCSYHHWLVHEGGWTLRRDAAGDYQWTGPHGQQRIRHLSRAPAEISRVTA